MEVLYPRCAGLDVHRDTVVACRRLVIDGKVSEEVRTFGTMTEHLLALSDWLSEAEITHVAMEATGVYWKPVWHVLEACFQLVLANAMHIKNVPGRKTDVNDATWIASLLAHGLIRGSFVPAGPVQELRALTRTRKQLVRDRTSHVQRIDKLLQDANIKLGSVLSDIMGASGRAILDAMLAGETNPEVLVGLVNKRARSAPKDIAAALRGTLNEHHRFLLRIHLSQADGLEEAIASIDKEVGERLTPFRELHVERLIQIPGVSLVVASAILSEIGPDMSRFRTVGHLISWAGLCPRNDESAGKRRSTRTRKSAPWLKTLLVQSAWAAARTKGTYLRAQFARVSARRGPKKAIMAVAASILTAVYYMLGRGEDYVDLTPDHFTRTDKKKNAHRLLKKLDNLGYDVSGVKEKVAA